MKRIFSLLLVLSAVGASAQTIAFRRLDSTLDTYTFGAGQCADTVSVQWSNTLTVLLTQCTQNPLKVWATEGECGDAPASGDKSYDSIPAVTLQTVPRQGTFTVTLSELPGFNTSVTDGGTATPCGTTGVTVTHKICGNIEYGQQTGIGACTTTKLAASPLTLTYDMEPPDPPAITAFAEQDKAVKVEFTADADVSTVTVEVRVATDGGEGEWTQKGEASAANKVVFAKNLQNTVQYEVRLRAVDAAGNVSEPSSSILATPINTLGFYGTYRNLGGTDGGGCSTGTGLFFPALMGLWALARARRRAGSTHS